MADAPAFAHFAPQLATDDHRFVVHGAYYWQVLRYDTGRGVTSPHVTTLCGPSGRNMLEVSPVDHLHHRGLWWGHGDVNGVDYYLELPGGEVTPRRGTIRHQGWHRIIDAPPEFGFVEDVAWHDDGGVLVIAEQRSLLLTLAGDHYRLDLDSSYTAQVDLTFGDTKEAVLPGVRLAEALTGLHGATISTSEGHAGEQQAFGQPARWLDVSGWRTPIQPGRLETTPAARRVEGIAVLDHPANPGHPTRWFVREYGPLSPFPGHHFHPDRRLAAGATLRLRHRLVVHPGTAEDADIDDHWQRYAQEAPP